MTDLEAELDQLRTLLHGQIEKRKEMADELDELRDRVGELEAENDRLKQKLSTASSKEDKLQRIVEFADNLRGNKPAVKLKAKDIQGAAGISRRYAYDLIEELPEEYDWCLTPAEMEQYGSIERDMQAQDKALGIDFEGVHSHGVPVNKFTTGHEQKGVET